MIRRVKHRKVEEKGRGGYFNEKKRAREVDVTSIVQLGLQSKLDASDEF
jgi:hypothetical protein